jgi:hypothetical protein
MAVREMPCWPEDSVVRYELGRLLVETKMRWTLAVRYHRYYRYGYPGYTLRLGPFGFTWQGR